MRATPRLRVLSLVLATLGVASPPPVSAGLQSPTLNIVVVEGEAAINIIQQKTAVAPVIEVRDRNNQPVAGAVVNFAIRTGRATFSGARALSVTTNAAGRAIAAGFAPTGTGALQISATAAFQGQTVAVTIAQTTVQTAAQAAAIGASAAGTAGSSGAGVTGAGAGAGGGGGLSGTTLGVVGAAAAGGTALAVEAARSEEPSGPTQLTYAGGFSGTLVMTFPGAPPCARNEVQNGALTLDVTNDRGTLTGTARIQANIAISGPPQCMTAVPTDQFDFQNIAISGTAPNLTFTHTRVNALPPPSVRTYFVTFDGAIAGNSITGTLSVRCEIGFPTPNAQNAMGLVTHSVTLQ